MNKLYALFIFLLLSLSFTSCSEDTALSKDDTDNHLIITRASIDPTIPISITSTVQLNFSTTLDDATIDGNVYLKNLDTNEAVESRVDIASPATSITITPLEYLEADSSYMIVVTTAVRDTAGRSLSKDYEYNFSTLADEVFNDENVTFTLASTKPADSDTDVWSNSDIVINYSKRLANVPKGVDLSSYFSFETVLADGNTTPLNMLGNAEVFSSIVNFNPIGEWPRDTNISVSFDYNMSDLYGNEYTTPISFTFSTWKDSPYLESYGYGVIDSVSTSSESYMLTSFYDFNDTRTLFCVARNGGINLYALEYPDGYKIAKPSIASRATISLSSRVTEMLPITIYDKYILVVTTIKDGVYVYDVDDNSIVQKGHYLDTKSVYGVDIYLNSDNIITNMYAVGPSFGLHSWSVDENFTLSDSGDISTDLVGEAIDVKTEKTDMLFVADYGGKINGFNLNDFSKTTFSTSFDMSVRKLKPIYTDGPLYVVGTSGEVRAMDPSGSMIDFKMNSSSYPRDMMVFGNFTYSAVGENGLVFPDSNGEGSTHVDTGGEAISVDGIRTYINPSYILSLNSNGVINLYNSDFITGFTLESVSISPVDSSTIALDGNISVMFNNRYIDEDTISSDSFALYDDSNNSVAFTLHAVYDIYGNEYIIDPDSNLTDTKVYTFSVKGSIKDMINNSFNDGVDHNISITAEAN